MLYNMNELYKKHLNEYKDFQIKYNNIMKLKEDYEKVLKDLKNRINAWDVIMKTTESQKNFGYNSIVDSNEIKYRNDSKPILISKSTTTIYDKKSKTESNNKGFSLYESNKEGFNTPNTKELPFGEEYKGFGIHNFSNKESAAALGFNTPNTKELPFGEEYKGFGIHNFSNKESAAVLASNKKSSKTDSEYETESEYESGSDNTEYNNSFNKIGVRRIINSSNTYNNQGPGSGKKICSGCERIIAAAYSKCPLCNYSFKKLKMSKN